MKIQIITLFPGMFTGILSEGMMWKAQKAGLVEFSCINLRDYGLGTRKTVDDTPYGGGDGMLLRIEPLVSAIEHAKKIDSTAQVYLPTPRGITLHQSNIKQYAQDAKGMIIICPRYEGYDERIVQWVDIQYCIGNYILTGGDIAAMVIIDSVVRLIPGVLGGEKSAEIESFQDDDRNIEFPQFTRPELYRELPVPDILLSGNHKAISEWRQIHAKKSEQ
ncbi:MAG: tRNA (guanosine(37)-N1)-methyltransferase TrmD [Candidatus Saccharimonadales bacterium]